MPSSNFSSNRLPSILGLSLVEMLITVCVAATIMGLALPSATQLIASRESETVMDTLRTSINFSRHTAIALNANVIMCPLERPSNDIDRCGRRNTWHNGALIFADFNGNRRIDGEDHIAGHMPAIDSGRIFWRAFRNRSYLQFNGSGITNWQNGHMIYCASDGDLIKARQVTVNYAGRTYSSKDSDGDGVHEDGQGRPLRCPNI